MQKFLRKSSKTLGFNTIPNAVATFPKEGDSQNGCRCTPTNTKATKCTIQKDRKTYGQAVYQYNTTGCPKSSFL